MNDLIYDHELDATPRELPPTRKRCGWSRVRDGWDWDDRILIVVVAVTTSMPPAGLSMLYGIAARTAWALGRWPSYGHPDPKDLPHQLNNAADDFGLLASASVFAVLTAAIVFGLSRLVRPERLPIVSGILVATCWIGGIALLFSDPFGVLDWLLD
jgi:hypothetical protein